MKEVAHYIEQLLLRHDCVIVPGLGGFVAQDCPARYVKEENIFLPPYRSVSFNSLLTMNDGTFINEVASDCGASYAEAFAIVRQEVQSIKATLLNEGRYRFSGIGTLEHSADGTYDFIPLECGVLSPMLHGLDCFYVEPLTDTEADEETSTSESKKEADSFIFRIPKSIVRYAAAAAVAAVFFFVCIAPLQTAIHQAPQEASMLRDLWTMITAKAQTERIEINPAELQKHQPPAPSSCAEQQSYVTEKQEVDAVPQDNPAAEQSAHSNPVAEQPAPSKPKPFVIVVSSAIPESGAQRLVVKLQQRGIDDVRVVKDRSMIRVVYGSYATESEAHDALRRLHSTDECFAQSWVYYLP